MKKSVKVRKIIFEILNEIYNKNKNFDESYNIFKKNTSLDNQEQSMIFNVVLNSMRNKYFVNTIINQYLIKRTSLKIKILLLSAITQILYLDFKVYAVTNDSVEIAKIKRLNPGLVNSLLKNIIRNSEKINRKNIDLKSIPNWLLKSLKLNKIKTTYFIETISKEPSLHLVFKNKILLESFKEENIKTTEKSAFLKEKRKINEIENYSKGIWWVQDFSSMLPIYLSPELISKKIIDLCSAPGGKAFQLISQKNNVYLNDISKKRSEILRENIKRLNFENNINNFNALEITEKEKYDVVILDSPCSGIGTVRRNPEILFKKKQPNFEQLFLIQTELINKAASILKKNGTLMYMVCSFLYEETKLIKYNFLKKNRSFSQLKFEVKNEHIYFRFIDKDGDICCTPSELNGYMIDGFYAVKFIKKY